MDKKFNVVYDNWDLEQPIANLINTTRSRKYRILDGLFNFYKMSDIVKNCHINDVARNPNENYFYMILIL